jgi:hypothetical protein
MHPTDFKVLDFWFWSNDIGIPSNLLHFCMGIAYSSRNTESSRNNSMRSTHLSTLLNNIHRIWACVMSLMLGKVILTRDYLVNLLEDHLPVGCSGLLDGWDVNFPTCICYSGHFVSVAWLVISRENEDVFASVWTKNRSGVSNISNVAIIVNY